MNKVQFIQSFVFVILLVGTSPPSFSEDWPTYRHDFSRTAATNDKIQLPLHRVWEYSSRQSRNAPRQKGELHIEVTPEFNRYALTLIAAQGSVFFTSASDGRVGCLNAETGELIWEFVTGSAVGRSATYSDKKIYIGSDDGNAYCIDAKSGDLIWKYKAAPADRWMFSFGQMTSAWPVRTDIVVDNGIAYFGAGVFPHDGTFVYALDAQTGKKIWRNGTHCETLNRWSLAPVGYIYTTQSNLYMPMDFKQFHWAVFNSYKKSSGQIDPWAGTDSENPVGYGDPFYPIIGALHDKHRYHGNEAFLAEITVDEKTKKKQTKTERLWQVQTPEFQTDIHSVSGVPVMRGTVTRYDPDMCSVIYAGGVVFNAALKTDIEKGATGKLFARDPSDGKELWTSEIPEWPNQLIAAGGRLFVSTRDGRIHAYANNNSSGFKKIEEPINSAPSISDPMASVAADEILKAAVFFHSDGTKTKVQDPAKLVGEALVLDCESGSLAYAISQKTDLRLYAVFDNEKRAERARTAYNEAGVHVSRITVLHLKEKDKVPYPSRFADFIFSERVINGGKMPVNIAEIKRLQKPIRGLMIVGGKQSPESMQEWFNGTDLKGWKSFNSPDAKMNWIAREAPRLDGGGGWTHGYGDAGNTMCSHDSVLKAPLGVAWYGPPYSSRGAKGISPPIIVDGVLVCQFQDYIFKEKTYTEGYDQYTGRRLWRREKSMTDTIAAPGSIFQRFLEVLVQIDPWTGKEIRRYLPPFKNGQWSGMSADSDGKTLYLSSNGKDANEKDWSCILGLNTGTGEVLWILGGPGKEKQWSRWNSISDGRLYFLGEKAEGARREEAISEMAQWLKKMPGEEYKEFASKINEHDFRVLRAVDARTGELLYEHGVDISNAGGGWTRSVVTGGRRSYQPVLGGAVIAHGDVVAFATVAGADKSWAVWPSGGYKARAIAVHDGGTGKLLWYRFANYRARPVVTDDLIVAEPWAFDLKTGNPKTRIHPITGEQAQWAFCRYNKQCGTFAGSRYLMFGRSRGVGYHDLLGDDGLYTFLQSRASCWIDTSSGGGMMIKPPHAIGCKCEVSMPFTIALAQVPQQPAVPQTFAQPGPQLPVRHLNLDLGGTGERRDNEGNLWVIPRKGQHQLLLQFEAVPTFLEGGGPVQRSANYTPIANTKIPFVFASCLRGMQNCVIPVTTPELGKFSYRIRVGFSALPGDEPGQRVFDMILNGNKVLEGYDILNESGQSDHAVWKEFVVEIEKDLTIELSSRSGPSDLSRMPLINAVQVHRIN